MKKILSLLSFLMLAVVAMAADLTTGVTFKGTWGDKLGDYPTAEGEMTVTKVDEGLKFEVKSNGFNGYAFPAYTLVYKSEVAADGSFNTGDYFIGEITGDPTMDGLPVANLYWQQIKGTVTNDAIDLYIRYMGVNMTELEHITFKGEAVASPDPEPVVEDVVLKENYQADGTGFKESTAIDWETQKFQAVIDASNCNASRATEELLGFGPDATVWNDNVHVYCKSDGTYTAFYEPTENRDAENPNNNSSFSVEDKSNITIEISKAEGLVIDGKTIIAAERLNKGLFDLTEVTYGSGEGTDQYSTALYKSIKLINLNKKEEPVFVTYTAPAMYTYASEDEETPGAKRFVEAQEIQLSDNGDGTYTVIIKNLGDCEGDPAGDIQFTATATEAEDGTISLTADTKAELGGYYEGSGEYAVKFNGTLNGEDLTATYDIDIPSGAAHAEFGNGVTNGINTVNNTNNTITSIYTVGGAKVNSLQKGVNIVRLANGKTVKVIK